MTPPPFRHPAFRGFFGIARRDITPPVEIYARNWGAAKHDVAASVHQPFTLTVLTMQPKANADFDSDEVVAVLSLDLGWWRSAKEEQILAKAVRAAGIREGNYFLALSHTHAGPVFCPDESGKPGGEWIEPYLEQLSQAIQSAIREACSQRVAGWLECDTGSCHLAKNRDFADPADRAEAGGEGKRLLVGWNPEGEADSDTTLLVGRVSSEDGKPLAVLVNYACHPTILAWENDTLSPEFPGAMREVMEREIGAPVLFLQGASGELAPRHQYTGDLEVAERAGRCLGYAALSVWSGMLPPGRELRYEGKVASGAPLALWREAERSGALEELKHFEITGVDVSLAIRPDLPQLAELQEAIRQSTQRVEQEQLQRRRLIRQSLGDGESVPSRYLIWQLGEIRFLSVSNEAYSWFQTTLRASIAPTPLFVATVTNGTRGYLVPKALYDKECYTAWQTPFAAGELERSTEILRERLMPKH